MALREKLYTADEFFEIASLPENDEKRLELDDGEIIDMGASSRLNTVTASRINYFLSAYVIPKGLGYVTGADGGFKLASGRVRLPDTAFIAKSHGVDLVGVAFAIAPDLAIEVVSPDEDIFKKAREYLDAGTRIVWAVYAEEKTVYVFQLDADGSVRSKPYDVNATLDGGDVLPDFRLPVSDIFPE